MKLKSVKNYIIIFILSLVLISQYSINPSFALLNPNENTTIDTPTEPTDDIQDSTPSKNEDIINDEESDLTSEDKTQPLDNNSSDENNTSISSNVVDVTGIDENLIAAIKDNLQSEELTEDVLNNLVNLDASGRSIKDISGLKIIPNLEVLNLDNNQIKDVTPISLNLSNLKELSIENNAISDISSLSNIQTLHASNQSITITQELKKGSDLNLSLNTDIQIPIDINGDKCLEENIKFIDPDNKEISYENSTFTFYSINEDCKYKIECSCSESFRVTYIIDIKVTEDATDDNQDNNNDNDSNNNGNNSNNDNNSNNSDNNIYVDNSKNEVTFITQNNVVVQNVKVVTKVKNFINNKTPLSSFSKIKINANDKNLYVGDTFNPLDGVTSTDSNGQDLTKYVLVSKNTVITNSNSIVTTPGTYEVIYEVKDTSGAITSKAINVTVLAYGEKVPENVKTGDSSKLLIFGLVALVALLGLVIVNKSSKNKKSK